MPSVNRDIVDAELVEHPLRDAELALSAVDQHKIGPTALLALGILFERAGKAAQQHLAHHCVIVPASGRPPFILIGVPKGIRPRAADPPPAAPHSPLTRVPLASAPPAGGADQGEGACADTADVVSCGTPP